MTYLEPRYIEEGQVAYAVWDTPITTNAVYITGLWQRAVGSAVMEEHAEHSIEFGWLLDDKENPRFPLPGSRRRYFDAVACFDCLTTYACVPTQ